MKFFLQLQPYNYASLCSQGERERKKKFFHAMSRCTVAFFYLCTQTHTQCWLETVCPRGFDHSLAVNSSAADWTEQSAAI